MAKGGCFSFAFVSWGFQVSAEHTNISIFLLLLARTAKQTQLAEFMSQIQMKNATIEALNSQYDLHLTLGKKRPPSTVYLFQLLSAVFSKQFREKVNERAKGGTVKQTKM